MCGICGELSRDGGATGVAAEAMGERLRRRGPDGAGLFVQGRVALGHRRLKIIDLTDLRRAADDRQRAGAGAGLKRGRL